MRKSAVIVSAIVILFALRLSAFDKINTTRKNLSIKTVAEQLESLNTAEEKTLTDSINISGYDKTVTDKDESFYLTNNTEFTLSKIVVRFTYRNLDKAMLHEETYGIDCDIPPHSTRQLTVRSWDKGHTHYYHKSRKPRRSAIPYTVSYTLLRYDIAIKLDSY